MRTHDDQFEYRDVLKRSGTCGLRMWKTGEGHAVMVSELPGNHGPSVTNASEQVAEQVCERFALNAHEVVWIEHYFGEPGSVPEDWNGEHYDLIQYNLHPDGGGKVLLTSPRWQRIPKEAVEKMVGEKL